MWSWFKSKKSENAPDAGASKRHAERLETAVLTCSLGTLLDVSRTGLRIRSTKNCLVDETGVRDIELLAPADSIVLRARLVRTQRERGGWYEHAFEFLGMDESLQGELERLVTTGRRKATGTPMGGNRRDRMLEAARLPDHYAALELGPQASAADIHGAFRRLARLYHPDVNREPQALERFCRINEAHDVLGDEASRASYDALYRLKMAA